MSMISAQIEEMRETANEASRVELTDRISTPWMRNKLAPMLRNAADTIGQLRDDLQRTNAENTDLRQQLADVTESMGRVEERCAKLRELLARVERARRDLCDAYPDAELLNCEECPAWSECKGDLADRMRELGVEVDK